MAEIGDRGFRLRSFLFLKKKKQKDFYVASRFCPDRPALASCDAPRGDISEAVSIRERAAEIEDRAGPGHWEGDLISGNANTHIATLVERRSRYVMLVKLDGKDSQTVVSALVHHVQSWPHGLMELLTWDCGKETAQHKRFTIAANVAVYFCDPQSPWPRGSNENTNGLLRQYFPKGTDVSQHSQQTLDAVALQINTRPRKTLGFKTSADIFNTAVALTG